MINSSVRLDLIHKKKEQIPTEDRVACSSQSGKRIKEEVKEKLVNVCFVTRNGKRKEYKARKQTKSLKRMQVSVRLDKGDTDRFKQFCFLTSAQTESEAARLLIGTGLDTFNIKSRSSTRILEKIRKEERK